MSHGSQRTDAGRAAGAGPERAATDAALHALVNCFLRESPDWRFEGDEVAIPVLGGAGVVRLAVAYRSATFRHRFAPPARLQVGAAPARPLPFATLAALLADCFAPPGDGSEDDDEARAEAFLAQVLDSRAAVAEALAVRADDVERLWSAGPLGFGAAEQALLLGHMVHPSPKARLEMDPDARAAYSPELGARFPLRWLAVRPELVVQDSATGTPAAELVEALVAADPAGAAATLAPRRAGLGPHVLVPAHPWQFEHLARAQPLAGMLARGDVVDLGPAGAEVLPTTSLRSVYQPHWAWQLKFSLDVRVTNSMRVTLPKELTRAREAATLAASALGRQAAEVAPRFRMVHDPAHLAVRHPDGGLFTGLSVLLRENHWPASRPVDVSALTTLCQDHPWGGPSRLAAVVADLARRSGRDRADVAREWFARFCDVAVVSLVRLYAEVGLCFEAHQQNTLLELDDGWPATCVYRDSQGYFHRELAHADVVAVLPGLGEVSESIFPEALADERLVYYLFVNMTLGVVNALGVAGCIDEQVLLDDLARVLAAERARPTRYPTTLLDRLLDDPTWPCKANLQTRLRGMDELVGDIAEQSVYVRLANPLAPVPAGSAPA